MEKVAVNHFVKRQVKGSGKTYSDSLSFETIASDAEKQMILNMQYETDSEQEDEEDDEISQEDDN